MKENTLAMNFEPHKCVIFVQSTKIGTHENKAIPQYSIIISHSKYYIFGYIFKYDNHMNNY